MLDRGAGKMSTKDVEHERCWAGKIVSTDCWRAGRQEMTVSGAYDLLLQWQEAEWGKRAVRAYMGYDYIISRTVRANQEFPALSSRGGWMMVYSPMTHTPVSHLWVARDMDVTKDRLVTHHWVARDIDVAKNRKHESCGWLCHMMLSL